MKKILLTIFVIQMMLTTYSLAFAQKGVSTTQGTGQAESPDALVRKVYQTYLHMTVANDPLEKRVEAIKKYLSDKLEIELTKELKSDPAHDYFLDGAVCDPDWEKNIFISNLAVSNNKASLFVILKGAKSSRKLKVEMVSKNTYWKIDNVSGSEP